MVNKSSAARTVAERWPGVLTAPRERANVVDAIKQQASKAEERGFDIDAVTENDPASWGLDTSQD